MAAYTCCGIIAVFLVAVVAINAEVKDYKKECHIDKKKPAEEPDNYLFCNTPEAIENNSTTCCKQDGAVQCCETKGKNTMLIIGLAIAGCTLGLGTACVVVFWFEPEKVPCIRKCLHRCTCGKKFHEPTEEELNLSDMAEEIRKSNRTYMQGTNEFAPDSKPMPEECKGNPSSNWWDSSLTLKTEAHS